MWAGNSSNTQYNYEWMDFIGVVPIVSMVNAKVEFIGKVSRQMYKLKIDTGGNFKIAFSFEFSYLWATINSFLSNLGWIFQAWIRQTSWFIFIPQRSFIWIIKQNKWIVQSFFTITIWPAFAHEVKCTYNNCTFTTCIIHARFPRIPRIPCIPRIFRIPFFACAVVYGATAKIQASLHPPCRRRYQ